MSSKQEERPKRTTNSKPIPHIPLPFKEVMKDVLKVRPPKKTPKNKRGLPSDYNY